MCDKNNKKDIEIVEGMGNIEISPIYDDLSIKKPTMQNEKPKNIVIPEVKKSKKEDAKEETSENAEKKDE